MNRWIGKVAVVTGASSGIGTAIVKSLVLEGMIVIGLSRREDRLKQLKDEIIYNSKGGEFHFFTCDVSNLDSVKTAFGQISKTFGHIHVLVNNAGIAKHTTILEENNENTLKDVINVNLMGPIYCIKEAYKLMKATGELCHIININSIVGHRLAFIPGNNLNLYPSTKFGLRAAGEVLRQELVEDKNFRITNISPGLVKTEISEAGGNPNADKIMSIKEILLPEDVAQTVKFALEVPNHVQISELIVEPVGAKF